MSSENTPDSGGHIYSAFWNEDGMHELIEFFIEELDHRVCRLQQAWRDVDADAASAIAHQLKGAAGGYGFDAIGTAAGLLEAVIAQRGLTESKRELEKLVDLCRRAVVGAPESK